MVAMIIKITLLQCQIPVEFLLILDAVYMLVFYSF